MQLSVIPCLKYSGSYSGRVCVVKKADVISHGKECGPHCGHVFAVAEHLCPGHYTHAAMLVCLDLGNEFVAYPGSDSKP